MHFRPGFLKPGVQLHNVRVTDAKEVGVGNPAEGNVLSPDFNLYQTGIHLPQPVRWHSFTIFCRCRPGPDFLSPLALVY